MTHKSAGGIQRTIPSGAASSILALVLNTLDTDQMMDVELTSPSRRNAARHSIAWSAEFCIMKAVSVEEAIAMIPAGASIMVGGFMGVGTPQRLVDEMVRQQKAGLSVISNDAATPGKGIGKLFDADLVSRLTASHIGLDPKAQQQMLAKQIYVDLIPQGTLVERIRAGGSGLGGVLTPTGVGTKVADRKLQIEVDGKMFLVETALRAEFALVHAFLADYLGNLSYALTARNFNPIMAMAAETVI